MKGGLNPGKVVLRWSKWVKVGLNPGKVVLRWSKWVKVGLNPGTVVLRWSKWVKVGVNPGKVVLRECKRVKGGLNPDTGVLRWSKRVKGSLINLVQVWIQINTYGSRISLQDEVFAHERQPNFRHRKKTKRKQKRGHFKTPPRLRQAE